MTGALQWFRKVNSRQGPRKLNRRSNAATSLSSFVCTVIRLRYSPFHPKDPNRLDDELVESTTLLQFGLLALSEVQRQMHHLYPPRRPRSYQTTTKLIVVGSTDRWDVVRLSNFPAAGRNTGD